MFLKLNHQQLDVYTVSRQLVHECYQLTRTLPQDERFGIITQIRRAALSVHLNIAEGASRKSETERKRFFEIARGSLVEVDAALDVASDLQYLVNFNTEQVGVLIIQTFKILSGMFGH